MVASRLSIDIENLLLIALEQGASVDELHGIVEWVEDYYASAEKERQTR